MATSPPASPGTLPPRPLSAMVRHPRSNSRMSTTSRPGESRASDEDGRTSVKVAVRVRPPLQPTDTGFELIPQRFQRSTVHVQSNTSLAIECPQGRKLFVFDRVFGPEVDQEGVWEYLQDSVNALVTGYNVSLLAYGQSGAGKSYTMGTSGPLDQADLDGMGVIPRAATALFEKLEGPKGNSNRNSTLQLRTPSRYSHAPASASASLSRGEEKSWTLKATYVEIYNEQLRDLLIPEHVPAHERGAVTIREDVKGNIILTGLRQVEIHSVEDLMKALNEGSTLRQTDATAINARSSRSHAVFSLNLTQRKSQLQQPTSAREKRLSVPIEALTGTETWITTESKLHFVDLAGSERLKNTGAQGERAKEGISINAGLAALGKVISQLSSRQPGSHVSYRDSRLTRLLQDSLGGNAITYMIACVTPPEFHVSETLNTVQYAQRARAIQSKPRIQQVEEGDKQAIIERLKAEVAFLRDQARSAEHRGADRRSAGPGGERSERQNEREMELQNRLLDTQENYTSLSQRHAKLIAEMAKARDNEQSDNQLVDSLGDSATERLNRSNSFAQAVEQVVLEYEKTIQSLEQSLSSTRSTLANTEASLLERETKCAFNETINAQLQARLQKLMDREASTENYLQDLENKLDGHTSGEEKNTAIVVELRKEIARIRQNEAACEDYISTLEERLAEADQDAELMQREIDRLEQVIERQRSLGKLDSLLYELDSMQTKDAKNPDGEVEHGGTARRSAGRGFSEHSHSSRSQNHATRQSNLDMAIPEGEEDASVDGDDTKDVDEATPRPRTSAGFPTSPSQSRSVADKLDTVTRELVDLRVEHESTLSDFGMLSAKYEEALRAIAELQDAVDESTHPRRSRDSIQSTTSPTQGSFLSDGRSSRTHDGTRLSSRSLSSELSSALDSQAASTTEPSEAETAVPLETATAKAQSEMEALGIMADARAATQRDLVTKYAELQERHQDALDMVEELKTEMAKAQYARNEISSPRQTGPIRRKSTQNVMVIDRAHRSFASLRNIAAENFEDFPDVMQNFELNLNAAMHELHVRSERIQELEADVASAKKEMDAKMTIISGLTRERSSLKVSGIDMATIANLREQLAKNESKLKEMQHDHAARERELEGKLEELGEALERHEADAAERSAPARDVQQQSRVAELEHELATWEDKHQRALGDMSTTEEAMTKMVRDLERQVASYNEQLQTTRHEHSSTADKLAQAAEAETKHRDVVDHMRSEMAKYKDMIDNNAAKVAGMESQHSATRARLEAVTDERDRAAAEAATQRDLVSRLQSQMAEHERAVRNHGQDLEDLRSQHAREVAQLQATRGQSADGKIAALKAEFAEMLEATESDLTEAREELMKVATQVAFALGLDVSVEKISERIDHLIADQKAFGQEQAKREELEQHVMELSSINDSVMRDLEAVKTGLTEMLRADGEIIRSPYSVADQLQVMKKRMGELETRNKKNSHLVEELEDQLHRNYDQVQLTNNRLSSLQTERNTALEEVLTTKAQLQSELDGLRQEYAILQGRFDSLASGGDAPRTHSTINKSPSAASLPSPPPAIPLPPLPGIGPSTAQRPPSKDVHMSSQIHQDQEARIFTISKHLEAEKQLTATLEEALTDLEEQQKRMKTDLDVWRRRAGDFQAELKALKEKPLPNPDHRWSVQQVEEERRKRRDAELANMRLEERMTNLNKKKKKGSLNCF